MVQITSECTGEGGSQTGAAVVAIVFLSIFAALILGDAILSALAIKSAIDAGKRPLDERLRDAFDLLQRYSGPDAEPGRLEQRSFVLRS